MKPAILRLASGISFERVRWWLGVGAWAMVDQALFALANFAFNILLARWLDPVEYGAFAAGYALLWLVWSFYRGLLLDPAMVFSSKRFRDQLDAYHSSLLIGHALLSIGFVCAFLAAGAAAYLLVPDKATLPWVSLALAGPLIFLPALLRGLCRARLQTSVGAPAAVLYAVAMAAGVLVMYRVIALSAAAALAVMAAASAAAGVWLIWRFRLTIRGLPLGRGEMVRRAAAEHWRYGRWLVGVSLLSWLPMNVWYTALPLLTGIEDAGVLRALVNLAQPAMQGYAVLHSILIPMFVLARENQRFRRTLNIMMALVFASAVLFSVVVGAFAKPLIGVLYGGRYAGEAFLVWPILLATVAMGVSIVQSAAMQALERADWLMASYGTAAVVVVLIGLPATAIWGLGGAVFGQFCAISSVVLAQAWWLHRYSRRIV
jgi:O-antigen/teichoic acid export membrane protein